MMNSIPVLAITIGVVLLILLGVLLFVRIKYKQSLEPDYRVFFILGLIWIALGVINVFQDGSVALGALGVIFLAVGLGNRDKWRQRKWADLPPEQRRMKIILMLVILGVMVLGLAAYFWVRLHG
jgi:hypothetical protein